MRSWPLAALAVTVLAGCASAPLVPEPLPQPDYSAIEPSRADGAIYREGTGLFWFEDRLASRVGDALTVILSERTQAQKSARTSTGKDGDFSVSVPLLGGKTGNFNVDSSISSERSFNGSGDSAQSNSLVGELSVLVIEVLPNGYLKVAGEKNLRLNQGVEYVRLTGIVRPEDISPQNTVLSTRVAQAEIAYSGRGAIADANAMGWLSRFFHSPLWPF